MTKELKLCFLQVILITPDMLVGDYFLADRT